MSMPAAWGWRVERAGASHSIPFVGVTTGGGRAGPQRRKQMSKLLIGMNVRRENKLAPAVLTSDLHGGGGPKLTHGFYTNTMSGPEFTAARPPHSKKNQGRPGTRKFLAALLHFRSGWRANHLIGCQAPAPHAPVAISAPGRFIRSEGRSG